MFGRSLAAAVVVLIAAFAATTASAQVEDETKNVKSSDYIKRRPIAVDNGAVFVFNNKKPPGRNYGPTPTPPPPPPTIVRVRIRKRAKPNQSGVQTPAPGIGRVTNASNRGKGGGRKQPQAKPTETTARFGFTIWRLRDASETDKGKGFVEVDTSTGHRVVAERLNSDDSYKVGELIRMGIEPLTHEGYLYVIEREKYADGTTGTPNLVYPTLQYRQGDNYVKPGVLTFIPPPPVAFRIDVTSDRKQVAEELIIVISPKPLIDPSLLRAGQITIPESQTAKWIKDWQTDATQVDQVDSVGTLMTNEEHAAGVNQTKGLTAVVLSQTDPLPQTMIEMKIKPGDPIVTSVTLPIKQN